jgi:SAM-dependent methyltransferase
MPLQPDSADIAVFNASLHYAVNLNAAIGAAAHAVRPGGWIVILDSPFYRRQSDGLAMVAEKNAQAAQRFGERAEALLALPFAEFLTRDRLEMASWGLGLDWERHRVRYPLWYELRSALAALRGARAPSRFDLWASRRA